MGWVTGAHRRHGTSGPDSRAADPVTVYLARLTSSEPRRAMTTSLELLAELLVDGHPAGQAERARRRRDGRPLAMAVPWHELRYGHTQALRAWLAEHCSPAAANRHLAALRGGGRRAMAAWLDVRGPDDPGPLFRPIGKAGRIASGASAPRPSTPWSTAGPARPVSVT